MFIRKGIKLGRKKEKPEPLEDREIQKIVEAAQNNRRDYLILRVFAKTGARLGEVQQIRAKDIDFERHIIFIFKAKRSKRREVLIDKTTLRDLKFWITDTKPGANDKIFPVSYSTVKKLPGHYAGMARVDKRVSCHSFRHWFITKCERSGMDIEKVRQLVGHENIGQTSRYMWEIARDDIKPQYDEIMSDW